MNATRSRAITPTPTARRATVLIKCTTRSPFTLGIVWPPYCLLFLIVIVARQPWRVNARLEARRATKATCAASRAGARSSEPAQAGWLRRRRRGLQPLPPGWYIALASSAQMGQFLGWRASHRAGKRAERRGGARPGGASPKKRARRAGRAVSPDQRAGNLRVHKREWRAH